MNNKGDALFWMVLTISFCTGLVGRAIITDQIEKPKFHKERTIDKCEKCPKSGTGRAQTGNVY